VSLTPSERASLIQQYADGPQRLRSAFRAVPPAAGSSIGAAIVANNFGRSDENTAPRSLIKLAPGSGLPIENNSTLTFLGLPDWFCSHKR